MAPDPTVELIRALVQNAVDQERTPDWEALASVLEFGDGFRAVSGYLYLPNGEVESVACSWERIDAVVNDYLASHYEAGDRLPVAILVQFDRTAGQYEVTFEETETDRWRTRPSNFEQMPDQLRPAFG